MSMYIIDNRFVSLLKSVKMEYMQLYIKISSLPNDIKSEVNDFIDFLLKKRKKEIKKKEAKIWLC